MRKLIIGLILAFLATALINKVSAQTPAPEIMESIPAETQQVPAEIPQDEYSQAKVIQTEDSTSEAQGFPQPIQKVKLQLISGPESGKTIDISHGELFAITEDQKVQAGDTVVLVKTIGPSGELYYITDQYRITPLVIIFGLFFILVVIFGRLRGVTAILGLILSIIILVQYVVPQILGGANPLTTSLIGALVIAVLSLYLAHGINKRTTLALAATIFTLCIAAVLSLLYVSFANLSGTGSEEAIFLRMGPLGGIDLRGLLLGGIIIGTLGILDDITTSQTAAVEEIRKANPKLTRRQLFTSGVTIGREHVASLVNTLALAYVGASFPLLLLFSLSEGIPMWLTLNSEFIAEELVRTLVGSTALILAVPISTFLAAYFLGKQAAAVSPIAVAKTTTRKRKTTRKKK